ncbi:MAG TPA: rhodanese-like domain-containing protein [Steroidobacteraceae bacterium]|nr:rhodanese-like domain-containing protein [Steroidobacteraceae bacterium]
MVQQISPRDLKARLAAADPPVVLDVREAWELEIVRLAATVDIPMDKLAARIEELPKDRDIVVMCKAGGRSAMAADFLHRRGYRALNLTGGILGWARDVDPSLPTY